MWNGPSSSHAVFALRLYLLLTQRLQKQKVPTRCVPFALFPSACSTSFLNLFFRAIEHH